jgi:hypothetical protein
VKPFHLSSETVLPLPAGATSFLVTEYTYLAPCVVVCAAGGSLKPFCLSSENVLPVKRNRSTHQTVLPIKRNVCQGVTLVRCIRLDLAASVLTPATSCFISYYSYQLFHLLLLVPAVSSPTTRTSCFISYYSYQLFHLLLLVPAVSSPTTRTSCFISYYSYQLFHLLLPLKQPQPRCVHTSVEPQVELRK